MVTLYKTDKTGKLRFFTVHDLQRSLLEGYALTVNVSVGDAAGKDRLMEFADAAEAERWIARTFASKRKDGYSTLYRYGSERTLPDRAGKRLGLKAG